MKIAIGLTAVAMPYFAGRAALSIHDTVAALNPYWLALAAAMAVIAGRIYLRARFNDDLVQFRQQAPITRMLFEHRFHALTAPTAAEPIGGNQPDRRAHSPALPAHSEALA